MKSKVGKISAILFLLMFILASLFIINIVRAQNVSSNITNETFDNSSLHVLENFTNKTVSDEISDNSSAWGGGEFQIDGTVKNLTFNETKDNLTIGNETFENKSKILEIENDTSLGNETFKNITENVTKLTEPVFDISFEYPLKITRGETITVKGVAKANSNVKNVVLEWVVPEGFEIASGEQKKSCGDLEAASSCVLEIGVKTVLSTNLGIREIKIVVSYEK